MANAARSNGVKYITGDTGYVKSLLYDNSGTCIGVLSVSNVYVFLRIRFDSQNEMPNFDIADSLIYSMKYISFMPRCLSESR